MSKFKRGDIVTIVRMVTERGMMTSPNDAPLIGSSHRVTSVTGGTAFPYTLSGEARGYYWQDAELELSGSIEGKLL